MKKIISILLALALIFSMAPCIAANEALEQCEIQMSGNLINTDVPTPCLNVDTIAYIPAEYAAMAGDCAYQMTDTGVNFYCSKFDFVTAAYHQDEQGVVWVPIASTLEQMEVKTAAAPGVLATQGKYYSPNDVIDAANKVFDGKWRISALDGVGSIAITSATVFNVITEWKLAEFVTGKYEEDQYHEAFILLMQKNEQESGDDLLAAVKDADGLLSTLSKLEKASVGAKNPDDIMEAFRAAKLTNGETLLAFYDDFTNPLKTIADKIEVDESKLAELYGEKNKFDGSNIFAGLDVGTQFEVYEHLTSIMKLSTYYVDMVDTVLFSDYIRNIYSGKWGDVDMINTAKDLIDYFRSDSYKEILEEVLVEEATAFIYSGINEALESATQSASALSAAFRVIYDGITEFWTGTSHSETVNDEEMSYYLANIQATARDLYRVYSSGTGRELEAKYAALLYLRCAKVWSYLFEEQVPDADFEGYREALNELTSEIMSIPDFDIIGVVENEEIYYEDIKTPEKPVEVLPPSPADGKLSTVINVDGFEYQYDIQLNHDGTAFVGGGMPFSEYDEIYEGTYTLLENETPDTFHLKISEGLLSYIGQELSEAEKQEHELILQITPIDGTEEYTVSVLSEDHAPFYVRDLPNFTFIPYT